MQVYLCKNLKSQKKTTTVEPEPVHVRSNMSVDQSCQRVLGIPPDPRYTWTFTQIFGINFGIHVREVNCVKWNFVIYWHFNNNCIETVSNPEEPLDDDSLYPS